jgi:hypothetical protein
VRNNTGSRPTSLHAVQEPNERSERKPTGSSQKGMSANDHEANSRLKAVSVNFRFSSAYPIGPKIFVRFLLGRNANVLGALRPCVTYFPAARLKARWHGMAPGLSLCSAPVA